MRTQINTRAKKNNKFFFLIFDQMARLGVYYLCEYALNVTLQAPVEQNLRV